MGMRKITLGGETERHTCSRFVCCGGWWAALFFVGFVLGVGGGLFWLLLVFMGFCGLA
jgi:hypothetical protein